MHQFAEVGGKSLSEDTADSISHHHHSVELESPSIFISLGDKLSQAHALRLGVEEADLLKTEFERGLKVDPRLTRDTLMHFAELAQHAQLMFHDELFQRAASTNSRLKILLAPTSRTMDHVIEGNALKIIIQRLVDDGKLEELRQAINSGPGDSAIIWDPPTTKIELVASILRWGALTDHDKKRIRVSADLRKWIGDTLAEFEYDTKPRLGGIAAVCTELAHVLGHAPTMMALGKMPPEIAQHLKSSTRIVGSDPAHQVIAELPAESEYSCNFCLSIAPGGLLLPHGLGGFEVNGKTVEPAMITKIDILITGTSSVAGFAGLTNERLSSVGKDHNVAVLNGTKDLSSTEKIEQYLDGVTELHKAGCVVAICYAESRYPKQEVELWRVLRERRCVEFLALNAFEARGILERIDASLEAGNPLQLAQATRARLKQALKIAYSSPDFWEDGHEAPEWVFESAVLLQEILKIPIMRVRGMASDVVVVEKDLEFEQERVRDYQIVSRYMGSMKVAHPGGLFKSVDEIGIVRNIPDGTYMAGLLKVWDRITLYNRGSKQDAAPCCDAAEFLDKCYARLADGKHVFVVPPLPFYSTEGGPQSAGDVMDFTFAVCNGASLLKAAWNKNIGKSHGSQYQR